MIVTFTKETNFKVVEADGFKFEVPDDWEVVRLGDVLRLKNGERPEISGDGQFPVYGANGIMGLSENYLVDNDYTIVIGRVGASGEVHLAEGKVWISDNAIYSENYDGTKLDPRFIYYLLKFEQLNRFATKSTHPIITQSFLKSYQIPLPPLPEQQKIAHVLMSIDRAIEAVDEAIKQAERIKKGLMQELLTKGIGHTEFKDTEIGRIPKEWEVVRLGETVEVYDHKRIPLSEQERANRKGSYPYCGATGIIDYIDDYIFEGEYILLAEDGGYFGPFEQSAYIMNGKFWVNNHAHVLKARDDVANNWYLMYFLNYIDLRPYIVGSTRAKLNQSDMRRIFIPLPPLPEQQKIAEILSKWDEVIKLKRAKKERLERMKKKVMELLLTGKVRIKGESE